MKICSRMLCTVDHSLSRMTRSRCLASIRPMVSFFLFSKIASLWTVSTTRYAESCFAYGTLPTFCINTGQVGRWRDELWSDEDHDNTNTTHKQRGAADAHAQYLVACRIRTRRPAASPNQRRPRRAWATPRNLLLPRPPLPPGTREPQQTTGAPPLRQLPWQVEQTVLDAPSRRPYSP